MELPAYHAPAASNVLRATWERGWSFIKRAGTVILLSSIIIWFLQAFGVENGAFGMVEDNNNSLLAAVGSAVAFIFIPLGFGTWQATVGVVGGLVAKENLVAIMGICYGVAEASETGEEIWGILASELHRHCGLQLHGVQPAVRPLLRGHGRDQARDEQPQVDPRRHRLHVRLRLLRSLMIYQLGGLLLGQVAFSVWTVAAIIVLAAMLYFLLRKSRYNEYGERLGAGKAAANA